MISDMNAKQGMIRTYTSGMAEYPEEVHPQHGRAASLGIEEMAAQISIHQQHDLGRG